MSTQSGTEYPSAAVPDRLFDDAEAESRWRARFHAPRISVPEWAIDAPDANVYVSNASGVWEVYSWDRSTGEHRRVTDRPNGTMHATPSPDGRWIWWFNDTDGDEFGSWVREPFAPGAAAERAVPDVHDGYPAGLEIGTKMVAVGVSTDDGSELFAHIDGETTSFYKLEDDAGIASLSRDESLLVISHSEHGDSRHPALRVLSTDGFTTVADKWDGEGKGLGALEFSPVEGDQRLLVLHERRGREELLIWDTAADTEQEIELDLPGEVVAGWYPDATALLVVHFHQGRSSLHRYDLSTGELSSLDTPPGRIGGAGVRPDGTVEYSWSSAARPTAVRARTAGGEDSVLLEPPGDRAPESVPVTDAFVDGIGGQIHALVSRPADAPEGPLPTVFSLHGGPHSADEDRFSAYRAVWLDAGFAVVEVNYRGSTGYGSAWRDAIEGRPGLTELEDVAAVHDWAVQSGLSDPEKCVVNGASWGGYLSLLALGTQPARWAAGIAGVPVADYVAAYEDEMEQLRSFDRALFGGSPETVPAVYRECSPITYVEAVTAPVLVLAGDNDPRCPIRQVENYLDRLAKREIPFEFYRFDAGHGSLVIAETIKQTAIEVFFALRAVGLR
ncbi:prolyl oligopeptidase family serine peptidase [Amycolatopsis keratiniphila]|uniref:prolyl oligopeptidase family serine peptidase n=1 Tax=Amycolatopsis keratiniphila TaxID=129921 RepID=UPI00087BEDDA|nr:prolyl oligopeptidase family serine peptidase [Amycolatopsis keratiniphila]OLZ60353.1 S9 family peptidase [Amycolatopsis keratiniphila subsp. nogabecina]SDU59046.1 Dipeptidyl aminopeptidase/acylaminoacyl peptidase [Amycolatopsis keratiniphila]